VTELLAAVKSGNGRRVLSALQRLTEAERAAAAPTFVGRHDFNGPTFNLAILGAASMKQMRTRRPGPLLVLFDEFCAQTETGPLWSRDHLATLSHKTARALVKREHAPSATEAQLALAARVRRARRWSTR